MFNLSLGFDIAFSTASQLITDLLPVYLLPVGITLGLMILGAVGMALRKINLGNF